MYQYDDPTAVATLPASTLARTPGYFSDGTAVGGVPATELRAEFMNMLMMELLNVVEGAGITPNKAANNQLLLAIQELISASEVGGVAQTGDVCFSLANAKIGWILCNDGTVGSAASGATYASATCNALYTLLWNNVSQTNAPVTGGRGASAAADWAANKPIALTKMLGRALASAGAGGGLTARNLGDVVGEETHLLAATELPAHPHPVNDPGHDHTLNNPAHAHGITDPEHAHGVTDPEHAHSYTNASHTDGTEHATGSGTPSYDETGADTTGSSATGISINAAATGISVNAAATAVSANSAETGITVGNNTGGGGAHNNMQPTVFLNVFIKL